MDYQQIGLNNQLRRGLAAEERGYVTALKDNLRQEPTPYLNQTSISKGTIQTTLGGLIDFRDKTGGTSLVTLDPASGLITLNTSGTATRNLSLAGTTTISQKLNVTGTPTFSAPGTIQNTNLVFTGGSTQGTAAVRMFNNAGSERITLGIDASGYGYGTIDQLAFTTNIGNLVKEVNGVTFQCADAAGVHAVRIYDSSSNEKFTFTSKGYMEIKGTQANPGAGGVGVVRLFVQNNAGKDQLRAQFNTGASVVVAAEP